jgi:hypothetical protein
MGWPGLAKLSPVGSAGITAWGLKVAKSCPGFLPDYCQVGGGLRDGCAEFGQNWSTPGGARIFFRSEMSMVIPIDCLELISATDLRDFGSGDREQTDLVHHGGHPECSETLSWCPSGQ